MDLNPEFLKGLIATFRSELDEGLQVITEGILRLEKQDLDHPGAADTIDKIFRAAHNIKGAAAGVGVTDVATIAHQVESVFSALQKNPGNIPQRIFNLCLQAVDRMRAAMDSFVDHTPLSFDLNDFLRQMESRDSEKSESSKVQFTERRDVKTASPLSRERESETIRVSLNNLDRVSALMEEMQVNRIAIDDHYAELTQVSNQTRQFAEHWKTMLMSMRSRKRSEDGDVVYKLCAGNMDALSEIDGASQQLQKNMRQRINELSVLSNSLQEEIRLLRLVPAATLLSTFPRLVRDLAQALNKKIDFEVLGDDVKMDRLVLEGLKDPLTHLLRNAIDHGIEEPSVRVNRGKPETGVIRITVSEEGNQILFLVSDDGGGMDGRKIGEMALAKKIISQAELDAMTETEMLELIFRPGFSTKDVVTSVSGRGVGLDVVRENITRLNGQVSVETAEGKMTTFFLRVPLTLASERGLMISAGGQSFAVPVSAVERVLVVHKTDVIDVEASQAIAVDKRTLPLRILADVLGIKKNDRLLPDHLPVVVVKKGWQAVAMVVDEIIGEREIVIKPLQAPLMGVHCVAGGTLAGNGRVIVVLSAGEMIEAALSSGKISRIVRQDDSAKAVVRPHILVVDDSITTRTLEKNVLENRGYQVTVAVNGSEAWNMLQNEKFSLLITDVSMPVMDGFTLTEKVKKSPDLSDLPVIIVTSLGSDAEKQRGVDAGANAYIVKSEFESGALLQIVSQLV